MPAPLIGGLVAALPIFEKVFDKVLPDKKEEAQAELTRLIATQDGTLKELEHQLSAILAEARSSDPFTSRARPSFLYVIYVYLLMGIPMGILFAFNPENAMAIADGMKAWVHAIPKEVWTLFGVGYLGYTGARSFDKSRLLSNGSEK